MSKPEKNTYRYYVMQGDKVIERGKTYDLVRREAEVQEAFPGARLKQVGDLVTWEQAIKWERKGVK